MIRFAFKFRKTLQAAAYLLRREPHREMNYMRLLKVLYIADRESIRLSGRPITGDRFVAMQRGPVLSSVLDLIKGQECLPLEEQQWMDDWQECIERVDYSVQLARDPRQGALSRFEIDILERVAEEHRGKDEWEMVEFTHTLPEWIKNNPGDSARPIPIEDVLEAVGRADDLADIEEDAEADWAFEDVFGS